MKFTVLNPAAVRSVQPGDTVFCVCAERNISETRNGAVAVPVSGHHELTGCSCCRNTVKEVDKIHERFLVGQSGRCSDKSSAILLWFMEWICLCKNFTRC